jgi:hypothetical protein
MFDQSCQKYKFSLFAFRILVVHCTASSTPHDPERLISLGKKSIACLANAHHPSSIVSRPRSKIHIFVPAGQAYAGTFAGWSSSLTPVLEVAIMS